MGKDGEMRSTIGPLNRKREVGGVGTGGSFGITCEINLLIFRKGLIKYF